jgi:erythromycin esterase
MRMTPFAGLLVLLAAPPAAAQAPQEVRTAFLSWADKSLHRVSVADLDASTVDLKPIARMLGDARIVGLSEGVHAAAEPLHFRNRLFRHLVETMGFDAIALESGIVESRLLNDYVVHGKGEFDTVLRQGLSWGFATFQQNRDLIRWMRDHNARLPRDAARVQIFGFDAPGSPGNFDAARRPDTALLSALAYLRRVDPEAAAQMQARFQLFLPVLEGIDGYGDLEQSDRDRLTAAIADLVSLMERYRLAYVAKSSKQDFDWAERAAIGARQTDDWFRQMPLGWKFEDGFAWTRYAMQVRDRAMADNLEWVRSQLGPGSRVLVFAAVGHLASTTVQAPSMNFREQIPFGAHVKARHNSGFINILNLVANGEIKYCSANPRRSMPLEPPPDAAVETLFGSVKASGYVLDLRRAPPGVSTWLHQVHDHWNGFGALQFPTADAFDLVYYVSPLTSACVPQ